MKFTFIGQYDEIKCPHCGNECWPDEMKNADKCWVCFVQDCQHSSTIKEYAGSTVHRVRCREICVKCDSEREIFFYYDFDMHPRRTAWTNENVPQELMYE